MVIIRALAKMHQAASALRRQKKSIGFVPTMGALHKGHLSLIAQARKDNQVVVVSVFVNPAQFARGEDLRRYPRRAAFDAALCRKAGVDILFRPEAPQMYPRGYRTFISVEGLSEVLCGHFRPGHFRGVATVVVKLLNLVSPHVMYLGQKDAQQVAILRKMVDDLHIPTRIKVMPIVREPDGLAMSSRNVYLSPQERKDSLVLSQALGLAASLIRAGMRQSDLLIRLMSKLLRTKKSLRIQYVSIVAPQSLAPVTVVRRGCLIMLAATVGKTRLIDTLVVKP